VVGVIEYERRGLINRRGSRAGGGIGLRAGMHGEGRKSRKTIGHSFSFVTCSSSGDGGSKDEQRGAILSFEMANSRRRNPPPRFGEGQSRQTRQSSRRDGGRTLGRNNPASRSLSSGGALRRSVGRVVREIILHPRHTGSVLFFAARSDALVWPPPRLVRLRDSCMPWVGIGARFELSVRELTPIHEISEDSRPYSILGQRFMTTLRPAASAFAAAASSRAPSCIQITFGGGVIFSASSTTGMMWLEFLKMSTMSMGWPMSSSDATKGFPSRLLPTCPGLTGIMS